MGFGLARYAYACRPPNLLSSDHKGPSAKETRDISDNDRNVVYVFGVHCHF